MKSRADIPDELLVVGAILGDLGAFDELVRRYRPAVLRTAEAVVGRADAEDVAQEALLLAFRALPTIEDPARFAAWLTVITRHRALRYDREQRRHHAGHVPLDDFLIDRLDAVARPPSTRESDESLRQAVDQLPPTEALVVRLRYFDEMPLRRIAVALGLPLSTVKWRLHEARRHLRDRMTP